MNRPSERSKLLANLFDSFNGRSKKKQEEIYTAKYLKDSKKIGLMLTKSREEVAGYLSNQLGVCLARSR